MKRKKISVDLLGRMPGRVLEHLNKNGYEVVVYGEKGPVALLKPYSKTAGGRSLPGFQIPLLEAENLTLPETSAMPRTITRFESTGPVEIVDMRKNSRRRKNSRSVDTISLSEGKKPENKRHKVQKNWRKRFRLFSYQSAKKLAKFGIALPFLAKF